MPCLLIAAKDDLDPDSSCSQNAIRVRSCWYFPFVVYLLHRCLYLAEKEISYNFILVRLSVRYWDLYSPSSITIIVLNVQVCNEMGVEPPISVSMKLGDIGNLFRRIVDAAQRPHLSIPETEQGRVNKHYRRLIQRSLTVAAGKLKTDWRLYNEVGWFWEWADILFDVSIPALQGHWQVIHNLMDRHVVLWGFFLWAHLHMRVVIYRLLWHFVVSRS